MYDPFSQAVREHPYRVYAQLRESDPINFNPHAQMWFLTRHADCSEVLRDRRFSAQKAQEGRRRLDGLASSMLDSDLPAHTRLRRPVGAAMATWRASAGPRAAALVASLLDLLEGRSRFDIIANIARPLAIGALVEALEITEADQVAFHAWARSSSVLLDPLADASAHASGETAAEAIEGILGRTLARGGTSAAGSFRGSLWANVGKPDGLTAREALMACDLLTIGGYDPTVHLIGNGMLGLLQQPAALELLRSDPSSMPSAIEELLRYDSPIQFTSRIATEDVVLAGKTIRAGQRVVCLLGAANRDPAVIAEPDVLDLRRNPNPHLGFGWGIHQCLGAPIARAVAAAAIGGLIQRFPKLELEEGEPTWAPSVVPRGLARLPVRV